MDEKLIIDFAKKYTLFFRTRSKVQTVFLADEKPWLAVPNSV